MLYRWLIDERMKQLHKPPGLEELAALCESC